ncbi:MAG: haloacid dehalogenase type II [Alkalicoccus sp.]|nr:MAG: haloacid dehalogenase type II [Alkalicoccus sp.]
MFVAQIKALLFDVFGTVVDYRSTIIREGNQFNKEFALDLDWADIADRWRGRYHPVLKKVLDGEKEWQKLDDLHYEALTDILEEEGITRLSEETLQHINTVWHRLHPWGDAVPGLHRLKEKHIISPLSNGNVALLVNMARHAGLPWDVILSPEMIQSYKPDPEVYKMAARFLDLKPEEILMTAAHQYDLQAAQDLGFRTAYVYRPLEFGAGKVPDLAPEREYDYTANDFIDLADQLRC